MARPVAAHPADSDEPGEAGQPLDVAAMVAEINSSIAAESERHSLKSHAKTFLGIGGIIFAFAAAWAFQTLMFLRTAQPVSGITTMATDWQSTKGRTRTENVVRYQADGQTLETSARNREVGEPVELLVSSHDPSDARVNSFSVLWGWPIFLAVVGGTAALLGGSWILSAKPRRQAY